MNLFLLLLGILLTSIGLMFILLYTNLLTMGYSFFKFVYFISRRLECWYFVIGIILIIIIGCFCFFKGSNNYISGEEAKKIAMKELEKETR